MRSDKGSKSFTFHTPQLDIGTHNEPGKPRVTRQRLQDRFDNECSYSLKSTKEDFKTSQKRWTNLNLSSISLLPIHSRRVLRSGADKLSRTLSNVRTTFGTLSQKFRCSTRRRYRLKNESPHSPITPQTRSRHLLGRTPTKLYSPFGIESPYRRNVRSGGSRDKENVTSIGKCPTHQRESTHSSCCGSTRGSGFCCQSTLHDGKRPFSFFGPWQKFDSDLEEARIGIWEFNQTANDIVRRSLRH